MSKKTASKKKSKTTKSNIAVKPFKYPLSRINPTNVETRFESLAVPENFTAAAHRKLLFLNEFINMALDLEST